MIIENGLPEDAQSVIAFLIPQGVAYTRVPGSSVTEATLRKAGGLLLGVQGVASPAFIANIRRMRTSYPWLPIAVAGPVPLGGFAVPERLALHEAGADHVLSYTQPHVGDGTIAHSWRRVPLRRIASVVQKTEYIAEAPRDLMVRALAAPTVIQSVDELAALAQQHRTTLWKTWGRCERELPTPGVFVDWIVLLNVVVRKDIHRTWAAASLEIGARPSSIARLGKRLLGTRLSEFSSSARRRIFTQFLRKMIRLTPAEIKLYSPVAAPLLAAAALERASREAKARQADARDAKANEAKARESKVREAQAATVRSTSSAPDAAANEEDMMGFGSIWS